MTRRQLLSLSTIAAALPAQVPLPKRAKITSSVMLWTLQGTFEERVYTAARAGIQSVELVDEYAAWSEAEISAKRKYIQSFGLGIDALLGSPKWSTRPVSMLNPAHRAEFLADVSKACALAQKLEVPNIILMSGNEQPGMSYEQQFSSMSESGKRAAELAQKAKVVLIIEPLNSKVDHKGYFLTTCSEGLKLAKVVDNPNFRLLFDLYHEQVQTGDAMKTLVEAAPHVAVYHVADAPGRHDPGTGAMMYNELYKAIQKSGFAGHICMEYLPAGPAVPSLIKAVDSMRDSLV